VRDPEEKFMPIPAKSKHHGEDGPIHTSFNDFYHVSDLSSVNPKMRC